MIIAGLDPGKNGALVTLFEDGSTSVLRVPMLREGKRETTRTDYALWESTWRRSLAFDAPDVFVREQVGAWTGQGVKSVFSFGQSLGFATALIIGHAPIHDAPPSTWKAKLGLTGLDKAAAIALARELIPSLAGELKRAKDDGVAEAGLLAYYGKMTISERR